MNGVKNPSPPVALSLDSQMTFLVARAMMIAREKGAEIPAQKTPLTRVRISPKGAHVRSAAGQLWVREDARVLRPFCA